MELLTEMEATHDGDFGVHLSMHRNRTYRGKGDNAFVHLYGKKHGAHTEDSTHTFHGIMAYHGYKEHKTHHGSQIEYHGEDQHKKHKFVAHVNREGHVSSIHHHEQFKLNEETMIEEASHKVHITYDDPSGSGRASIRVPVSAHNPEHARSKALDRITRWPHPISGYKNATVHRVEKIKKPINEGIAVKKLRDIIPKSKTPDPEMTGGPTDKDEKKFVSIHKIMSWSDRNGNADDLYAGKSKKASDPKPDAGHKDAMVKIKEGKSYDAYLKRMTRGPEAAKDEGNWSKKIKKQEHTHEKTRSRELGADDRRREFAEETQIDELSKKTMTKYAIAAGDDVAKRMKKAGGTKGAKIQKRRDGIDNAINKISARNEETELNELERKTLKSYQRKATTSAQRAWDKGDKEEDKSMSTDGTKYPEKQARHQAAAQVQHKIWAKRDRGLTAVKKKLGEDVNENLSVIRFKEKLAARKAAKDKPAEKARPPKLDELSVDTLKSYHNQTDGKQITQVPKQDKRPFIKSLQDRTHKRAVGRGTAIRKILANKLGGGYAHVPAGDK